MVSYRARILSKYNDCNYSKQLRTRDCSQCNVYLYSLTDPIIETSQQIQFAPFNGAYHGIKQHFEAAHLEPTNNHWSQVYDFNDPDKSGKNWSIMSRYFDIAVWNMKLIFTARSRRRRRTVDYSIGKSYCRVIRSMRKSRP
jgi:hypothetical protein